MFRIENRLGRESQYFDVFVYTGTSEDIDAMQHIMIYIYIYIYHTIKCMIFTQKYLLN